MFQNHRKDTYFYSFIILMEKKYKSYYERHLKQIPDVILLDKFRDIIQAKENIRNKILTLFTLHISWDDNAFIADIQKELDSLQEKIKKTDYFCIASKFDRMQSDYVLTKQELQRRRYELVQVITSMESEFWTEVVLHIHNTATGKEIEVAPWFVKDTYRPDTTRIKDINLSVRAVNGLKEYGITTLWQLLDRWQNHNIKNFKGIKWLWKLTYREVEDYLQGYEFIK